MIREILSRYINLVKRNEKYSEKKLIQDFEFLFKKFIPALLSNKKYYESERYGNDYYYTKLFSTQYSTVSLFLSKYDKLELLTQDFEYKKFLKEFIHKFLGFLLEI